MRIQYHSQIKKKVEYKTKSEMQSTTPMDFEYTGKQMCISPVNPQEMNRPTPMDLKYTGSQMCTPHVNPPELLKFTFGDTAPDYRSLPTGNADTKTLAQDLEELYNMKDASEGIRKVENLIRSFEEFRETFDMNHSRDFQLLQKITAQNVCKIQPQDVTTSNHLSYLRSMRGYRIFNNNNPVGLLPPRLGRNGIVPPRITRAVSL